MGSTRSGRRADRATGSAGDPTAALLAATEHHREGRLREAEAAYRRVLDTDPRHPVAHNLLGLILAGRGDDASALSHFDEALRHVRADDPNLANIHNNRVLALLALDRAGDAVEGASRALAIAPDHLPARHNLALALLKAERFDEAVAHARLLVAADRTRADSHGLQGEVLRQAGRLRAAAASFRRSAELGDPNGEASAGLGFTLRLLGEIADAEMHLRAALARRPEWAELRSILAMALGQTGRFEEAVALAAEAAALAPDDQDVALTHAYLVMMSGDVPGGWDAYDTARRVETAPPVAGMSVLVKREQGVGDEILFATCYPDLIAEAERVHIEADPRLVSLFARSFPGATVVPRQILSAVRTDVVTCAGSLPGRYRRSLDAFPRERRVLVPDPERVQLWAERLDALGGGAKVGISWRSRVQTAERRLEYTRVEEWDAIFGVPGVEFVNLQYDECEAEIAEAERRFGVTIHRWDDLDLLDDFEGVAALVSNLDAVVAPRNAVAFLAGALGVDCVMLGNRYDWFDLGVDIEHAGHPWMPALHAVVRDVTEPWPPTLVRAARALERLTIR